MNLDELKTKLAEAIEQKKENERRLLKGPKRPRGNERMFIINRTELNTLEAIHDAINGYPTMLDILTSY